MNKLKHILFFMITAVILVAADQITKASAEFFLNDNAITVIPDFFSLELLYNKGAAFGILQNSRVFFCTMTIIVCLIIEFFYFRIPNEKKYNLMKITFIVFFSGAVGNLIDRVKSGSVVDYLAFTFGSYRFPSFNVADIFVSVSSFTMLLLILFYYNDEQLARVFSLRRNRRKTENIDV